MGERRSHLSNVNGNLRQFPTHRAQELLPTPSELFAIPSYFSGAIAPETGVLVFDNFRSAKG